VGGSSPAWSTSSGLALQQQTGTPEVDVVTVNDRRSGTATSALRASGLARLLPVDSSLAGALARDAD